MDDDVPASLAAASSLVRRVWMGEARGYGVVAARALAEGERLFEEYPLIAMQHEANRAAGVQVCERCFAFLGPLEAQVGGLLRARGVALDVLPDKLPAVDGLPPLPTPVPCPGGCSLRFCSEACARATFGEHHRLLCPCLIGNSGMESEPAAPTSKRGRPDAALLRAGIARIEPPLEDALDTMRLSEVGGGLNMGIDGSPLSGLPHNLVGMERGRHESSLGDGLPDCLAATNSAILDLMK